MKAYRGARILLFIYNAPEPYDIFLLLVGKNIGISASTKSKEFSLANQKDYSMVQVSCLDKNLVGLGQAEIKGELGKIE